MDELEELMKMSKEEFSENWKNGTVQAKSLEILGAQPTTQEDEQDD